MRIITKAAAIVTLAVPLLTTGCVAEGYYAYRYLTRVQVRYDNEAGFECAEIHMPDGSRGFTPCAKCTNTSGAPQVVTIDQTAQTVAPGGVLMSCYSRAWVMPPPAQDTTTIIPPASPGQAHR